MVMMVIHRSGGLWGSKASFVSGLQDLRSMLDHCSTVLGRWSHRHSGWPGGNPGDPWCRSFGHTLDISRHPNRACANTMLLIWSLTPCECKRLLLRKKNVEAQCSNSCTPRAARHFPGWKSSRRALVHYCPCGGSRPQPTAHVYQSSLNHACMACMADSFVMILDEMKWNDDPWSFRMLRPLMILDAPLSPPGSNRWSWGSCAPQPVPRGARDEMSNLSEAFCRNSARGAQNEHADSNGVLTTSWSQNTTLQ